MARQTIAFRSNLFRRSDCSLSIHCKTKQSIAILTRYFALLFELILIADLVMSLDNVLAVAAAAQKGPEETRLLLLIIGLGMSIPLIIFGSALLLKVMDRFPIIITLGAGLLGLLAGGMLVDDPAIKDSIQEALGDAKLAFEVIGVAIVILVGTYMKKRNAGKEAH
jgi:predicted tellurium resistance membrane protein TerC